MRLYTALRRPGTPMWKKVESPMVATTGRDWPVTSWARKNPDETVTAAPMQTLVSMPFWLMPNV